MSNFIVVSILGLFFFQFPNYTKHWDSSDVPGHSFAKFEEFNGKQQFKIKLAKDESFHFNYTTVVKKGKLHLVVKSSSKTVLDKELSGSDSGELNVENPKGEKYTFTFTAAHAEGSFDITYKAN